MRHRKYKKFNISLNIWVYYRNIIISLVKNRTISSTHSRFKIIRNIISNNSSLICYLYMFIIYIILEINKLMYLDINTSVSRIKYNIDILHFSTNNIIENIYRRYNNININFDEYLNNNNKYIKYIMIRKFILFLKYNNVNYLYNFYNYYDYNNLYNYIKSIILKIIDKLIIERYYYYLVKIFSYNFLCDIRNYYIKDINDDKNYNFTHSLSKNFLLYKLIVLFNFNFMHSDIYISKFKSINNIDKIILWFVNLFILYMIFLFKQNYILIKSNIINIINIMDLMLLCFDIYYKKKKKIKFIRKGDLAYIYKLQIL